MKIYFWEKPGLSFLYSISQATYENPLPGASGLMALFFITLMALSFQIRRLKQ
jgi:hypothetical protein